MPKVEDGNRINHITVYFECSPQAHFPKIAFQIIPTPLGVRVIIMTDTGRSARKTIRTARSNHAVDRDCLFGICSLMINMTTWRRLRSTAMLLNQRYTRSWRATLRPKYCCRQMQFIRIDASLSSVSVGAYPYLKLNLCIQSDDTPRRPDNFTGVIQSHRRPGKLNIGFVSILLINKSAPVIGCQEYYGEL